MEYVWITEGEDCAKQARDPSRDPMGGTNVSAFGQGLVATTTTTTAKHPLYCACGREYSPITLEKAEAQGIVFAPKAEALPIVAAVDGWPKAWTSALRKAPAEAIIAENACMVRRFAKHRGPGQSGALTRALDAAAAK